MMSPPSYLIGPNYTITSFSIIYAVYDRNYYFLILFMHFLHTKIYSKYQPFHYYYLHKATTCTTHVNLKYIIHFMFYLLIHLSINIDYQLWQFDKNNKGLFSIIASVYMYVWRTTAQSMVRGQSANSRNNLVTTRLYS